MYLGQQRVLRGRGRSCHEMIVKCLILNNQAHQKFASCFNASFPPSQASPGTQRRTIVIQYIKQSIWHSAPSNIEGEQL